MVFSKILSNTKALNTEVIIIACKKKKRNIKVLRETAQCLFRALTQGIKAEKFHQ